MSGRLRTLILDADGGGWSYVAADTLLRGLLKSGIDVSSLPRVVQSNRWRRRLLGPRYRHLSYVLDWREALSEAPELDVELCNINNLFEYRRRREAIRHYPLIIVLHSAAGDSMGLLQQTAHWFEGRRGRLVVFLGNEYDLMDRKVAFLRAAGADCVCSQLPIEAAEWIYADCRPARILSMPHALNPRLYSPGPAVARRVDIGFCGDVYHPFVGDIERNRLLRFFEEHGCELGLELDFRLNARMERTAWAAFLRQCAVTVGAESGTYYLDRRGGLIQAAKAYVARHPRASFEEIFDRFFRNPTVPYVSGKAISSRHFEPIGTKTCQLLLEGHYNGILRAGEHYIPIRKDLSNVREAVCASQDGGTRQAIVERTYEYVMDQHTYRHRVQQLLRVVSGGGGSALASANSSRRG
jgi:hypothetical protein